jgi:hypothetical protein
MYVFSVTSSQTNHIYVPKRSVDFSLFPDNPIWILESRSTVYHTPRLTAAACRIAHYLLCTRDTRSLTKRSCYMVHIYIFIYLFMNR